MKLSELYWHRITPLHLILWPLSLLFSLFIQVRKLCYWLDFFPSVRLPVPVIIVESITMGDGGKTPLVIWLIDMLQVRGLRPGVIARGNLDNPSQPEAVTTSSEPATVDGKTLLLAKRFEDTCPVWVGGDAASTAQALLKANPGCNVIICTNGLQHPRLERDFEIAVADFSEPSFGNGLLLPAGPLRTGLERLQSVNAVVINGLQRHRFDTSDWAPTFHMQLTSETIYNLFAPDARHPISILKDKKLRAITTYENSQWFSEQLQKNGLHGDLHFVTEDHRFVEQDFSGPDTEAIILPEEEALRCHQFAKDTIWALPLDAWIHGELQALILNKMKEKFADKAVLKDYAAKVLCIEKQAVFYSSSIARLADINPMHRKTAASPNAK